MYSFIKRKINHRIQRSRKRSVICTDLEKQKSYIAGLNNAERWICQILNHAEETWKEKDLMVVRRKDLLNLIDAKEDLTEIAKEHIISKTRVKQLLSLYKIAQGFIDSKIESGMAMFNV